MTSTAAEAYLDAAGLADGVTLPLIVSQGEYATSVAEAAERPGPARRGGHHRSSSRCSRSAPIVDRWIAADFDAAIALNGGRPDPDGMYGRYFTSTGNLNKVAGYSSAELDELFARGQGDHRPRGAQGASTRRSRQYLEDNAVWVWLFTSYTYTATTAERERVHPDGQRLAASTCARRRSRARLAPRRTGDRSAARSLVSTARRAASAVGWRRRAHPARRRGARSSSCSA